MLSSTVLMVGPETIIGTLILVAFLIINELIKKDEENKKIFFPVLFALAIIFLSAVSLAVFKILK
jgi:hypothetical protein